MTHDEQQQVAIEKIRPALTPEFMETLRQLAKTIGWAVDYVEVHNFLDQAYEIAGLEPQGDFDPYDYG